MNMPKEKQRKATDKMNDVFRFGDFVLSMLSLVRALFK